MAAVTWSDRWEQRFHRHLQLLRGRLARWRGARVGHRFGLGRGVRLLYPACFEAGDDVTIADCGFLNCLSERGVRFGDSTSIDRNLWLHCGGGPEGCGVGSFHIGSHSYIGPNAVMGAGGSIVIGDHVLMGPCVIITAESHRFEDPRVTIDQQGVSHRGVVIEDDCWIGGRVSILDGVTIGRGSVIGAGAVVTKSVAPFSVAVGVPARVIRRRGVSSEGPYERGWL